MKKKNLKRVISLLLCLVILCCPFANIALVAHANPAVVAWVAGSSVMEFVAFALGIIGIIFATKGAMVEASNAWLVTNPTISSELTEKLATAKSEINGVHTLQMGVILFTYLKNTVIPSLQNFFTRSASVISLPDLSSGTIAGIKFVNTATFSSSLEAFNMADYEYPLIDSAVKAFNITFNGSTYHIYLNVNKITGTNYGSATPSYTINSSTYVYSFTCRSDQFYGASGYGPLYCPIRDNAEKFLDCRLGFRKLTDATGDFLAPYVAVKSVLNGVDQYTYSGDFTIDESTLFAPKFYFSGIGVPLYNSTPLPYTQVIDYSESEFQNALQQLIDRITAGVGALDVPWTIPETDVEEGKAEAENQVEGKPYVPEWAMWWEKLGIKDLIDTVTQSKTITETDVKMPNLPTSIKDKFPFCVPFDLYYMIEKLNATGTAPAWDIPFKIQSLGINQTIPINLSGWESVAAVCRWANVLLFILALVLLTRNIIRA